MRGSEPLCSDSLNMLSSSGDIVSANVLENSAGKPSGSGHFPVCINIKALLSLFIVNGTSRLDSTSELMEGISKELKKCLYCVSLSGLSEENNKHKNL
jgi:hypothetical protein